LSSEDVEPFSIQLGLKWTTVETTSLCHPVEFEQIYAYTLFKILDYKPNTFIWEVSWLAEHMGHTGRH
jgi:hypothetical protein